jgi:nucleoid-associated protein YgaU
VNTLSILHGRTFRFTQAIAALVLVVLFIPSTQAANRNGASSALILVRPTTARALGLSGALTSDSDDISAFAYNPATLASLKRADAAALYEKGMADDRFSALSFGTPVRGNVALGASAAYYDGGTFDLFDGVTHRNVDAKRDLVASVGAARRLSLFSAGVSAKYISSSLIEQSHATALAFDAGVAVNAPRDVTLGAAVQNVGSNLKYGGESDPLRRVVRLGAAQKRAVGSVRLGYSIDGVYSINESRVDAAVGIEAGKGPLAFRAGYQTGVELGGLTLGAGFQFGNASLDYALGLMNEFNSLQLVSLSTRFGAEARRDELARVDRVTEKKLEAEVYPPKRRMVNHPKRQVYVVQKGDTLEAISRKFYGSPWWSEKLFFANSHVLQSKENLKPGQRIWIP